MGFLHPAGWGKLLKCSQGRVSIRTPSPTAEKAAARPVMSQSIVFMQAKKEPDFSGS
jgi:hypothetical protein